MWHSMPIYSHGAQTQFLDSEGVVQGDLAFLLKRFIRNEEEES